jgi:phage shock protein PspC (stress-responsive transcriptional regulator)
MLVIVNGTQGPGTRGTAAVEDTLKDFWATRPRRPRRGRKIAGVAAGIGNRYGIDPIVVRVAFVVATFYGGAGLLFYLLGWLLLPEEDDEAAPFESMVNRRRSSTSTAFTVLLCLALIPAFWMFVDNEFSGLVGLLIVAGALFLLHRSRGHLNRPASSPTAQATTFAASMPTMPYSAPSATRQDAGMAGSAGMAGPTGSASSPAPDTPPAWDPLGAAPFAWDLPEPSPPEPEPPKPRRKSKVGLFTVGALLVTAGTLALIAPYVGGWLSPGHVVGIALAVLGLGMVFGSFVRGGRGLIGLAVPLSVIGLGLTVISPTGWHGVGEIDARPTTIEQVQPMYKKSVGSIVVDLTALPNRGHG